MSKRKLPQRVTLTRSSPIAFGVFSDAQVDFILWMYFDGFYLATNLETSECETIHESQVDDPTI
jgi:hypothetical protein